jgi:hypothetical protein
VASTRKSDQARRASRARNAQSEDTSLPLGLLGVAAVMAIGTGKV